jgi:FkbM family methyltransferase
MKKIVYDVGANNGDDIPYYLLKSDLVVAIEANPVLCAEICRRFAAEIEAGVLAVENCVAIDVMAEKEVDFYLHNTNHVLSQFLPPASADAANFSKRRLPARRIVDVIRQYGLPHYIKIDIEGFDAPLLRAMFADGIRPAFISAECHSIEVLQVLLERGGYKSFKLVDGQTVSLIYANRPIVREATGECIRYSFPFHSAGPFGNDVDGEWMTPEHFVELLAFAGFGWKDVHASNTEAASVTATHRIIDYLNRHVELDELLPYAWKRACQALLERLSRLPHRAARLLKLG